MGGRILVKRGRIRVSGSASPAAGPARGRATSGAGPGRDALAIAGQALDRFALLDSPRYPWPLLAASARACAAAIASAAAADHSLAERARHLLDRLRGLAENVNTAGPLREAHRLTFAAEAARAGAAVGAPGRDLLAARDAAAQAWDRLGQPYALAWALLRRRGGDGPG